MAVWQNTARGNVKDSGESVFVIKYWYSGLPRGQIQYGGPGAIHRDYLTIRLRARDFYEVIVDEGKARINYHLIEIESK